MEPFVERVLTLEDIKKTHDRIKPHVWNTPVITNEGFNEKYGRNFYFKCENMQKTGSFKVRGAMNAVMQLKENDKHVPGVVTYSSGNHGQAVALAAQTFDVPCTIVCPNNSPITKQNAIKNYGAKLMLCEPTMQSRVETAKAVQKEQGYHYISSGDNYDVIAGQGTIGLEFLEQVPNLDAIFVSACEGGMTAGICIAVKDIKPDLKVFMVVPESKELEKCLVAGERLWPNPRQHLNSVADGLCEQQIGHRNWPIILEHAEKQVFEMTEEEITTGTKVAFNELKVVVEPSAGICVAAAMSSRMKDLGSNIKNVGIVLCGSNSDLSKVVALIEKDCGTLLSS